MENLGRYLQNISNPSRLRRVPFKDVFTPELRMVLLGNIAMECGNTDFGWHHFFNV